MRVEWAKARARKLRWNEEYQLIQEEMRRVLAYLEYKAVEWEERAILRKDGDPSVLHGVSAYAHKQAHIARQMAMRCAADWLPELTKRGISPPWASQHLSAPSTTRRRRPKDSEDSEESVLPSEEQVDVIEVPSDEEDSDEEEDDDCD